MWPVCSPLVLFHFLVSAWQRTENLKTLESGDFSCTCSEMLRKRKEKDFKSLCFNYGKRKWWKQWSKCFQLFCLVFGLVAWPRNGPNRTLWLWYLHVACGVFDMIFSSKRRKEEWIVRHWKLDCCCLLICLNVSGSQIKHSLLFFLKILRWSIVCDCILTRKSCKPLNGHTKRFHPRAQKLEPPCTA